MRQKVGVNMSMAEVIESIEHGAFREVEIKSVGKPTEKVETSEFPIEPVCCMPLIEHRCSCGRLLGRFNGQAEVKCPKCGKMNVILAK